MPASKKKPIKVTCTCARRFRASKKLAGKSVECPGCGQALHIPSADNESYELAGVPKAEQEDRAEPESAETSLAPDGWESCPSCSGPLHRDTVFCTNCGFNRRTGEVVTTTSRSSDETFWVRLTPAVIVVMLIGCVVQTQLGGIPFLLMYVFLGFAGAMVTVGAEFNGFGKARTFTLCLVAWELLGVVRFAYGTSIGMQNFGFLFGLMVIAPFFGATFAFGKADESGSGWLGGSGCGGGGSCGGGGGCGGGCGGCGG